MLLKPKNGAKLTQRGRLSVFNTVESPPTREVQRKRALIGSSGNRNELLCSYDDASAEVVQSKVK